MTLKQLIGTAIALTFCLPMAVMAQNPDVLVPIAGSNAANDGSSNTSDNDPAVERHHDDGDDQSGDGQSATAAHAAFGLRQADEAEDQTEQRR